MAILEAPDLRATIAKDFELNEYKEISKSGVRNDVRFRRISVPLFANGEDQCLEHLITDLAKLCGKDRIMVFFAFKGTV